VLRWPTPSSNRKTNTFKGKFILRIIVFNSFCLNHPQASDTQGTFNR